MRAWHEAGHFIHITSHRDVASQDATARWLDRIGLPYDELYCSEDKVARCAEIGIDVLIDDSPENLGRAIEAGMIAATLLHPWNRELCERRTSSSARRGRARAQPGAGAGMSARAGAPAPSPTATSAGISRPSSRSGPCRTGGARSASRALLDRTLIEFLYHYWFRCEVEGIEHVPRHGGALLVANHAAPCRPTRR